MHSGRYKTDGDWGPRKAEDRRARYHKYGSAHVIEVRRPVRGRAIHFYKKVNEGFWRGMRKFDNFAEKGNARKFYAANNGASVGGRRGSTFGCYCWAILKGIDSERGGIAWAGRGFCWELGGISGDFGLGMSKPAESFHDFRRTRAADRCRDATRR